MPPLSPTGPPPSDDADRALAALRTTESWNHNTHYHRLIPRLVRPPYGRVLDVGCGEGLLTRRLAPFATQVTGVDSSAETVARARAGATDDRLTYVCGDVLTTALDGPYDLVTCFAVLHHLDFRAGLVRLRELTAPGGTLLVVGLALPSDLGDWTMGALALPAARLARRRREEWDPAVPTTDATTRLRRLRIAAREVLPGSRLRRRLYWRYSITWRAPTGAR